MEISSYVVRGVPYHDRAEALAGMGSGLSYSMPPRTRSFDLTFDEGYWPD
jgi:hypothetical protein